MLAGKTNKEVAEEFGVTQVAMTCRMRHTKAKARQLDQIKQIVTEALRPKSA